MNLGTLYLQFDDVVDTSTLNADEITIHNMNNITETYQFYQLTRGTTLSSNGFDVLITIHPNDLDEVKKRDKLAISINSTFITLNANAITDTGGFGIRAVTVPVQTYSFIEDLTRPSLLRFAFDLSIFLRP